MVGIPAQPRPGYPGVRLPPGTDRLFRPLYACFVVALENRRVVQVGVTRHPTEAWVAQRLREATPFGQQPRSLFRDNDCEYGSAFARTAAASGIVELPTAYRAPRQNATASGSGAACAGKISITS